MHIIFWGHHMKIVIAMVTEIVIMFQKTYGSRDNSKTFQANLMKLGICTGGNVLIIFFVVS